jgi:hypothetical protein
VEHQAVGIGGIGGEAHQGQARLFHHVPMRLIWI